MEVGLLGVLLREGTWSDRVLLDTARRLRSILSTGWLGLSDAPHLVQASGADAVHLSHRALNANEVRSLVGTQVSIGISDHKGHPRKDLAQGDYAFLSPVQGVPDKGAPLGFDSTLEWARSHPLPCWGLGGLGPGDVSELMIGGLSGVAFMRGILGRADPARAFQAIDLAMGGTP